MKISKTKLRQIIKEELGTLREEDPAEETALNSPSEAGRQWEAAKMNLTTAATAALEDGLSPRDIRNAIEEILSSAPDEGPRFTSTGPWAPEYRDKELEEGWKEFTQGAKDIGRDLAKGRALGKSAQVRKDAEEARRLDAEEEAARPAREKARRDRDKKAAAAKKERARADHHRWVNDDEGQKLARDLRMRRAGYKE